MRVTTNCQKLQETTPICGGGGGSDLFTTHIFPEILKQKSKNVNKNACSLVALCRALCRTFLLGPLGLKIGFKCRRDFKQQVKNLGGEAGSGGRLSLWHQWEHEQTVQKAARKCQSGCFCCSLQHGTCQKFTNTKCNSYENFIHWRHVPLHASSGLNTCFHDGNAFHSCVCVCARTRKDRKTEVGGVTVGFGWNCKGWKSQWNSNTSVSKSQRSWSLSSLQCHIGKMECSIYLAKLITRFSGGFSEEDTEQSDQTFLPWMQSLALFFVPCHFGISKQKLRLTLRG